MAMQKKVEITHRETIKPSCPTPIHLRILNLSLVEQFSPFLYIPLILFYHANASEKAANLKKSFSETLSRFYPLAGRIKGNAYVACEDQGAEFIEARINCPLSDILKNPDELDLLSQFLPGSIFSDEAERDSLLLVQATLFDCGGLAVGINMSHKITDVSTLSSFLKCWSAVTSNSLANMVSPVFNGASLFPPTPISIPSILQIQPMQPNCTTRRILFTPLKIAALKAKAASAAVPDPTKVEAISGLLWTAAAASMRSKFGFFRASNCSLAVNMRKRFLPPLPDNSAGQFSWAMTVNMENGESELELLQEAVSRIRKEKDIFGENYLKKFQGEGALANIVEKLEDYGNLAITPGIELYVCSSWCKFEVYDSDLGWGRPVWVCMANFPLRNSAVLMDRRDGEGMEAWFTLDEDHMALFETNEELLQFAQVNPSVSF
ncbi:BAHD acyltransferase BIA1-like [Mercurialis annua]|uniref:BAHD acyltransferase BIA1-like n=1 Tax=Mercurialis annua TaxID=3986 RepID=UPI00215F885D|nr:BAHD acyltransferase BIA1-like [Mercurialis annua]